MLAWRARQPAPSLALFALLTFLSLASSSCGGQVLAGQGDSGANAFVGTWTCTGTATENVTTPSDDPGAISSITRVQTFAASGETLTATAPEDGGSPGGCASVELSFSGSTATAGSGQTCTFNGLLVTIVSETFVVSGNTATSTTSTTLNQAGGEGLGTFAATVTVSSTCTRS